MVKNIAGVICVLTVAFVSIILMTCTARVDSQEWHIRQTIGGDVIAVTDPGWYLHGFNEITEYEDYMDLNFSIDPTEGSEEDESIESIFNDGGKAKFSFTMKIETPSQEAQQKKFHRLFKGDPEQVKSDVRSAIKGILSNTTPIMSASEHQSARKAELKQYIEDQLTNGYYKMRRISSTYKDKNDPNGKAITVYTTEIVCDKDGTPSIVKASPLIEYGIKLVQFEITNVKYDKQTEEQFARKKDAYLRTELAKIKVKEAVQERLRVEEVGRMQEAQAEADANVIKKRAVVAAEQRAEVAIQKKIEEETIKEQEKMQAKYAKEIAEIEYAQKVAIAALKAQEADNLAKATITAAKAEKEAIELAGKMSESERIRLEVDKETKIGIAKEIGNGIASVELPKQFIMGNGSSSGDQLLSTLAKLFTLEKLQTTTTTK
jgi:hypothetical protein